ncbi:MAG: rhodanese-like domain-containing protein [Patescibacteria group bacterium]
MKYKVILFYKFTEIESPERLMKEQRKLCESLGLKGRMFIAKEGINATFEGAEENIEKYKNTLAEDGRFEDIVFKESVGTGKAFSRLQVTAKKEVVTLGVGEFDIKGETAPEIRAEELEEMYKNNEDFVVLDLRNDFEVEVGYFDKTYNPNLKNFRDLPQNVEKLSSLKARKVVAVCTGGIRCAKATCLLKKEGFNNLYQLKDGIHTYIEKYPNSHFKGALFVFDNRMIVRVGENNNSEVVGKCFSCNKECEKFWSDDSLRPSRKVICCQDCVGSYANLRAC